MRKILFIVATTLLFIEPATASQRDLVEGCLKGNRRTASCYTMISNYWKHLPVIERVAREEGVDPKWMKALIAYESTYNSRAVSPVKATGLTQVMPQTAMGEFRLSREYLFQPETSVRAGARYLKKLYQQFGRMDLALAAFNAGPGRVQRAGNKIPAIRETQAYVNNIVSLYNEFERKERSASGAVAQTSAIQTATANRVALPAKPTFGQYRSLSKESKTRLSARKQIKDEMTDRFSHSGLRSTGDSL